MLNAKEIFGFHVILGLSVLVTMLFAAIAEDAMSTSIPVAGCQAASLDNRYASVEVICGGGVSAVLWVKALDDPARVIRALIGGEKPAVECTMTRGWVTGATTTKCK